MIQFLLSTTESCTYIGDLTRRMELIRPRKHVSAKFGFASGSLAQACSGSPPCLGRFEHTGNCISSLGRVSSQTWSRNDLELCVRRASALCGCKPQIPLFQLHAEVLDFVTRRTRNVILC